MTQQLGKWLIVVALLLLVAGLVVYFMGNKLSWLGRLPGDLIIKKENFTFYFPLTTLLLISAVLTALLWLIRWLSR